MTDLLMVKMTVEGQRHEIIQALHAHYDGLKERVAEVVDRAIADFDFDAALRQAAESEIRARIRWTLTDSLNKALEKKGLRASVDDFVERHLESVIASFVAQTPAAPLAKRGRRP